MRVLLLHPEDLPDGGGPWIGENWDLVVDLGFAGQGTYADWSRSLKSRVLSLHQFAHQAEGFRWVNQVFERGRGRLIDRSGLDWWEILAMESYQNVHALYLLRQLQTEIGDGPIELSATRPHPYSRIAEQVFRVALRYFEPANAGLVQRITRGVRAVLNLQPAQIAQVAFDKWDAGYQVRRHLANRGRGNSAEPCVLLPSAYSNVTRSVLAYASRLPNRKFLLVTTRRNAVPETTPGNVTVRSLAAYVQQNSTYEEWQALHNRWLEFTATLRCEDEQFRCAANAGVWDYFPAHLEHGLRLREAWARVLQSEPVIGVLCGDDLNYHTRLPLMLAQKKGLNAVYCSHGALDSGFFFRRPFSNTFLVKGEMERDYLERAAPVEHEKIVIGAPGGSERVSPQSRTQEAIIFFSQPYEVISGRCDSIYREIIPRLHSVARSSGRKLIIKLHPFESKRARRAVLRSLLGDAVGGGVEIVEGVPPAEVISRSWCGVTIDSSVAVECALSGIPFFLCGWLNFTGDGYLEQFARFGVAQLLNKPDDIDRIPQMVSEFRYDAAKLQLLWREADPVQLEEIMFGTRQARLNPCVC